MVEIDGHRIVQMGGNKDLNLIRSIGDREGGRKALETCFGSVECNDDQIMMREESKVYNAFQVSDLRSWLGDDSCFLN